MNYRFTAGIFIAGSLIFTTKSIAQSRIDTNTLIQMPASTKYNKSASYQKKWGRHYREEWKTPVVFPKAYLDTLAGGLIPYEKGGGRQSKSLRLRDKNDREYVLRSIDKSFGGALPPIARNTFIEDLVDDQVTIAHPYSAVVIAPLAEAAGIYHTNPVILYIPKQKALGEFNEDMGDILYLFEQRPDENWETAPNFGNSKKIVGTPKLLENTMEDNDHQVDQKAFVRARLFDIMIGDWGRHEDQWRWASFKDDGKTTYKPIPRDRDQAFTKFDGSWLKLGLGIAGTDHLQTFDHDIKDIEKYGFPARNLDRHFLNEVTKEEWLSVAKDIQQRISDKMIDDAVKKFPPEVYSVSGPDIASKIKSRKNKLQTFAQDYYNFLAQEVEVTGSEDTELFELERTNDKETKLSVYKITNEGKTKNKPFYSRSFTSDETSEIRVYGLKGEDQYVIKGNGNPKTRVRLIGGPDRDKYSELDKPSTRTLIYDNSNNEFITSSSREKLSNDSSVHAWKYDYFKYDKKGFKPIVFYNNEDRIYAGLAYSSTKQKWRKPDYGSKFYADVRYSLTQKAFSTTLKQSFREAIGKWDLNLFGNYDHVRWLNYFGLGNNTIFETDDRDYNRIRSREIHANVELERVFGKNRISFSPFYQRIELINDTNRYLAKNLTTPAPGFYDPKPYGGARLTYVFQTLNDSIFPTKGIGILAQGNYTASLKEKGKDVISYGGEMNAYLPFSPSLGIKIRGGAYTLSGEPEFYQYNRIGGSRTLRGYARDRFFGKSTVFDQNELRWWKDIRSYLFNGKFGIFAFYDVGRVWMDGETSDKWHSGYGGGFAISPFNKITFNVAFGFSKDKSDFFHFNIVNPL